MNKKPSPPAPETLDRLAAIVGARHALTQKAEMAPFLNEWRDKYHGAAAMVVRPGSVREVSELLAIANETGTAIVPQGGNTGLVGAQVPFESGHEVVLSLSRLNRIREVDAANNTLTADAGAVLADIQSAAAAVDRLFPLSLGAEGSCQIGGNLSSNAGGIQVLAYGTARDLALGLEVVLADGRVWEGLRTLRKDNTGYDLKHLFIGAEGTLGVITGVALKLFARPRGRATALCGLATPEDALTLLHLAQARAPGNVTSFELMPRFGIDIVLTHMDGARDPLDGAHAWYALAEISGGEGDAAMAETLTGILETASEQGLIADAVIAASGAQRDELWGMRARLSEMQKLEGASIKHDVSVPVAATPDFLTRAISAVTTLVPGCRPVPFGHLGDGNIHFNITQPEAMAADAFLARWDEMNETVHGIVLSLGGSISAEHGIGRLKRDLMVTIKSPVELDMMRALKHMLDPNNILNPGKLLPPGP